MNEFDRLQELNELKAVKIEQLQIIYDLYRRTEEIDKQIAMLQSVRTNDKSTESGLDKVKGDKKMKEYCDFCLSTFKTKAIEEIGKMSGYERVDSMGDDGPETLILDSPTGEFLDRDEVIDLITNLEAKNE